MSEFVVPEVVQAALKQKGQAALALEVSTRLSRSYGRQQRMHLLPLAQRVLDWAAHLAATGLLDPFGDRGCLVYELREGRASRHVWVRADGDLVVARAYAPFGGGTVDARTAHELVAADDEAGSLIAALLDEIDSGRVWEHLAR